MIFQHYSDACANVMLSTLLLLRATVLSRLAQRHKDQGW